MDDSRFDQFVRATLTGATRRGAVARLLAAPLFGGAAASLLAEDGAARKRRGDATGGAHAERKRKKKKKHKKKPKTCNPACGACFTCDSGACVVNAATVGQACGSPGQTCGPDGACGCGATSCANPTPLCVNGTCVACSAASQCAVGQICNNGSCEACAATSQCGATQICSNGACLDCDVCASGCDYVAVNDAINNVVEEGTVVVCPGTYLNANGRINRQPIPGTPKRWTVIGAGDGANPATNTILRNTEDGKTVAAFSDANIVATLRGLRITGGKAIGSGGGVSVSADVTLTDCTVTGNSAPTLGSGGGIVSAGRLTLLRTSVRNNSAGRFNGGGIKLTAGRLTMTDSEISGNHVAYTDDSGGRGGGLALVNGNIVTFVGSNIITENTVSATTNPGAGIYVESGSVTFNGFENVTVAGNSPDTDQCVGCPA
ncbi:MAG: hypothetical protein QM692_22885 [Thermomicrobiales bacterium]